MFAYHNIYNINYILIILYVIIYLVRVSNQ